MAAHPLSYIEQTISLSKFKVKLFIGEQTHELRPDSTYHTPIEHELDEAHDSLKGLMNNLNSSDNNNQKTRNYFNIVSSTATQVTEYRKKTRLLKVSTVWDFDLKAIGWNVCSNSNTKTALQWQNNNNMKKIHETAQGNMQYAVWQLHMWHYMSSAGWNRTLEGVEMSIGTDGTVTYTCCRHMFHA